ncbi:MAG: DUF4209 domain-containing protein [Okeania sp. SIO2F4]|uniref:DUF4209 domain-containing protein n=1 Tax=Okeania sp. SIO2F4 TaxID=2607790 RepID=UPI00142AA3D3|nr:DUF4209 domain-containing protein [Okeania sp. SIO2F4]NES04540.1 DUF4209 domain-containing protein [Okeania sp. SIO2F4]
MLSIVPPLTKEDFINYGWEDVVSDSKMKKCQIYRKGFCQKAREAEKAGNLRQQAIFEILVKVTCFNIQPGQVELSEDKFSIELTEEHLNFLTEIAPKISDFTLQAQVADIIWSKKRNNLMAELAVDAYIKSAIELENPTEWSSCFDQIERAFRLAKKIKNKVEEVVEHIEKVLDSYQGEDPLWLSAELMKLLQENKSGNPQKYAALAEKAALLAESSNEWRRARDYWEIKAKWHRIEKNRENERAALMRAAETYLKEAEYTPKNSSLAYFIASFSLQEAIKAFRKIPGAKKETIAAKERTEEAHKLLLQYQQESTKGLITISSDQIDITEIVEKVRASVRGKKLQDALFALAFLTDPQKISQLKKNAEEIFKYPLSFVMQKVRINKKGKVVARQSSILEEAIKSEPGKLEAAIKSRMYELSILYQTLTAQAVIKPAIEQINLEHSVQLEDFLPIVENNPFVPPERVHLFAKGLYAGLTGDFYTSTHILIPQIENSIRYLLQKQGVLTSKYDDKGIQHEYDFNKTLYLPEIKDIFDEDTLFDLKGLLVENSGSNLRNLMAHGLLDDEDFSSPLMSYLWWVTLRRCCSLFTYKQQVDISDPGVKYAGMFKNDPLFDDFVENMAAYRREVDEQVAAQETAAE